MAWICVLLAALLGGCRAAGGESKDSIVVTCSTDLGLSAKDSARTDWSGETRYWTAEAKDDTLRLVRKGRCGDECTFIEEIVLAGIGDPCPRLVHAATRRRDSGSPVPGTGKVVAARVGTLDIQDWAPSGGVVSGRLVSEFTTTFYVNMPKEE